MHCRYRKACFDITRGAGETEEQHQELLQFCRDFKFERMGAFAYSEEDGTPAAAFTEQVCGVILAQQCKEGHQSLSLAWCVQFLHHLDDCVMHQVPEDTRQARRDALISQQQDISQTFAQSLVGREVGRPASSMTFLR